MDPFATRARKLVGSVLVESFFSLSARAARLHPQANPARHGVSVSRNHRYHPGAREEHLLDVYRHEADLLAGKRAPIVFYVHGGGFRILSKDTHWVMGLGFAKQGFTVFNVNYRMAPAHRFPTALVDVCHAFEWVLDHAEAFGADPSRIILAGESAGANLVTSLALACTYRRPEPWAARVFDRGVVPRAVLPASGIFQVSDVDRLARRKPSMPAYVADRLREVEIGYLGEPPYGASLDFADPLTLLERGEAPDRPLPPFFLSVGTRDPLLDDTRRMDAALRHLGVPVETRYYPGEFHAFHAFVMRAAARQCWRDQFAFLRGLDLEHQAPAAA
ncbi:MAG: alpha/beta hydrolase [Polyangiaceae bacterium]|nr:alpha/beta hydrolase [Polyangiaceae bacterium]